MTPASGSLSAASLPLTPPSSSSLPHLCHFLLPVNHNNTLSWTFETAPSAWAGGVILHIYSGQEDLLECLPLLLALFQAREIFASEVPTDGEWVSSSWGSSTHHLIAIYLEKKYRYCWLPTGCRPLASTVNCSVSRDAPDWLSCHLRRHCCHPRRRRRLLRYCCHPSLCRCRQLAEGEMWRALPTRQGRPVVVLLPLACLVPCKVT